MSRRSKLLCPGCKTPKTCHDFGVRSKKCLGDTCGEDDSADLVLQEEIKQLELQRSDLLKKRKLQLSLENERLQIELRAAIPFEEQEHEAQETCPEAAISPPQRTKQLDGGKLTIKDLRKDKSLSQVADSTLKDWLDESSDDDVESPDLTRPRGKNSGICSSSSQRKPKSGSDKVGQDDI